MTDIPLTTNAPSKPPVFRNVLVQRVLIGLLFIALVPVIVVSLVNFVRTRNVLQTQAIDQLSSLSNTYSQQLEQFISTRRQALDQINLSTGFDANVGILYQGSSTTGYGQAFNSVFNYINQFIQTPTEKIFDKVAVIDSAGTVLVSSDRTLTGKNLTDSYFIRALYQTNSSVLSYEAGGLFPGKLVLITTKIYKNPAGAPGLSLIGFSTSPLPLSTLNSSQSFFKSSQGYLLTADNKLISVDAKSGDPVLNTISDENTSLLKSRFSTSGSGQNIIYVNPTGLLVYGYYKPLPFAQSNLLLEVPQNIIVGQVQQLVPFTLIILAALMLLSGVIVYFSTRRMVTPLTDLAKNAQTFAAGDWTYRAKINRDDEIGQLAFSFNNMVDQLTSYSRSLEEKVETRTHDLMLVSEIAQTANAGLNQREILRQASNLISEKLDIPYHAIYEVDNLANSVNLITQDSKIEGSVPVKNLSLEINKTTMVGWCAQSKQPRLSGNIKLENDITNQAALIESCASEMVIPIKVEEQIVALLDFQSQKINEFDVESSTVFSSLANQLSRGLYNVRLVESSQLGLKETSALYTASRQVIVAQSIDEVDKHLSELFSQTEYVSFFFSVQGDQIHLINIADPRGTRLDQSLKGFNIPLSRGLTRLSATGMQILDDLKTDADFNNLSAYFERRGCTSIAMLPIKISSEMGYLLVIGSREKKPISPLQMQPYQNLAQVIGATIERLSLLTNLNQRVRELNTLSSISQSATIALDSEDLFQRLHEEINSTFGKAVGLAIALNNEDQKTISVPYYKETERLSIPTYSYTDDLISTLITDAKTILHKDAFVLGFRTIETGDINLSAKSWLGLPLVIAGKTLGGLAIFDSEIPGRFTETEVSLLNTVLPQITSSIQITELLQSQQKALQAFEQEQFLLNSLLENIPDEVIFKNKLGEFIRVSESAARKLGKNNAHELVGQPDNLEEIGIDEVQTDSKVMEIGSPLLNLILPTQQINGRDGWSAISKIPLRQQNGEIGALLKISHDVTDLVNTQNIAKRRADQLLTTSEIAREATTGSLDIDETLRRLVNLVKTRFGFYHSSIFLLDALGQFAVLRESTGEAGAQLKAQGHKLAVGSASIIGQSTEKGEPVVVGDVTKEANYYPNPLLPNTKSEAGIPLKLGDRVYGALDVQSEEVDAFSQEDINDFTAKTTGQNLSELYPQQMAKNLI